MKVIRAYKPTHTDRYVNSGSNHHPSQKRGVIKTLSERARRICELSELEKELIHLERVFEWSGYSRQQFNRATRPRNIKLRRQQTADVEEKVGWTCLPYIHKVTDRIGWILEKRKFNTVFKPTRTIQQSLRSAKDKRDRLSASGVYRIPCSCGSVYIGTTKGSVNTRIAEHKRICRLRQTEKSAVAEHALSKGHDIRFEEVQVLDRSKRYYPRLTREAIEIFKHENIIYRKDHIVGSYCYDFPVGLHKVSLTQQLTNLFTLQNTPYNN